MRDHDKRVQGRGGAVALGCMMMSACAAGPPPTAPGVSVPSVTVDLAAVTESALADAARVTGLGPAEIELLSAESVTWGDGSLGCPEEGMLYAQVLVPGYRIQVDARGRVLDYHASRSGRLLLCPDGRAVPPLADTGI